MATKPVFCSVITRNYLPYARVLMASVRRHYPESDRHMLIADLSGDSSAVQEPDFTVHSSQVLRRPGYLNRAFVNEPGAFCAMLKPAFLSWILRHTGADTGLFVDSDSCFYHAPDALIEAARNAPFVLTPHILGPIRNPDALRNDGAIARSGTYNSGLFTARNDPTGLAILDWWADGMWTDAWQNQAYSWDQIWTPLIRQLFPSTAVFSEATYNVAYWNAPERTVTRDGQGRFMLGQSPLCHFHFSFFDYTQPDMLVRHGNETMAYPNADFAALGHDYARALLAANHDQVACEPYGYGRFHDGRSITYRHRDYFHYRMLKLSSDGDDPFDPSFEKGAYKGIRSLYQSATTRARLYRAAGSLANKLMNFS